MPITRSAAVAAMKTVFWAAWKNGTPALNGGVVAYVEWPNKESRDPPPIDRPWARFGIRHLDQPQVTIGVASAGQRRYRATGHVYVQVFVPIGEGDERSNALAAIVTGAFRGQNVGGGDAVVMREVVVREQSREDGVDIPALVTAYFEYDEIQ